AAYADSATPPFAGDGICTRTGPFKGLPPVSKTGASDSSGTPALLAQGRNAESNTVQTECQEKQIGKIGYNSLWANTMNDIIWMYTHGGEVRGPVSFAYLKSLADMGQIHSDSRVWKVGDNRWVLTNEFISPRQRQPLGPVIPDKSLPFLIEGVPCSERRVPGLDSNAKVILLVGLMIALVAAIIVLNIILPSKEPGLDEAGASIKLDKE